MSEIEFETINGQLCRMVEPTPLCPDSQFPCVVRLIQDDSPMGRMNRHYKPNTELEKYAIVSKLSDSNLSILGDKWNGYDIFNHEIIGYPVVEGSAEWAVYMAQQGNFVCHPVLGAEEYFWWNTEKNCISCKSCDLLADSIFTCFMLSGIQDSGWQIHEPEQELIAETTPCPACNGTGFVDSTFMDEGAVRSSCSCDALSKKPSYEPEPEPKFKVGDWVEWCGDQYMVESASPKSGDHYNIRSPYDELGCSVYPENITRKLSPSEVIVNIGCLSGTVRRSSSSHFCIICDCHWSMIAFAMLDAQTRELVESLLEAQEEKK